MTSWVAAGLQRGSAESMGSLTPIGAAKLRRFLGDHVLQLPPLGRV